MKQHALGMGLRSHTTFDNFYHGANAQTVSLLQALAEPFIYLWGAKESGKSHLLQACCHFAGSHNQPTFYLPLQQLAELQLTPEVFNNLEQCQLVCIDDLEVIAGQADWECALFDLYNRLREQGNYLIITASQAPTQVAIELPDLQSRLTWGITLQLQPLSPSERLDALTLHARARGFDLSPQVGKFLLNHYERSMGALMAALDQLDQASLEKKRKLTVPFVKQTLAI